MTKKILIGLAIIGISAAATAGPVQTCSYPWWPEWAEECNHPGPKN